MALSTLNGLDVIELRLNLPRVGVWHADVTCAAEDARTDKSVTLSVADAIELKGHVREQGLAYGTLVVDVIGGAGDFGAVAPVKNYRDVSFGTVLDDLLKAAGEKSSSKIASSLRSLKLSRWSTAGGRTIGMELQALVDEWIIEGAWRMLPDGSVWVGRDKFSKVDPEYEVTRSAPNLRMLEVVMEDGELLLEPGFALATSRFPNISYVQHQLLHGELRSTVFFEEATT